MSYVPPFSVIKQKIRTTGSGSKRRVDLTYEQFSELLQMMLRAAVVDSEWYLKKYPDVAEAIKSGTYKSAKQHFVEHGYFEGRLPGDMSVDEAWYVKTYEDVAESIKSKVVKSAREHFLEFGYEEGRLPSAL